MIYDELESLCLPLIEAFHNDLLKHDRQMIEDNPGVPFLHWTRACGTHMVMLPEDDFYPAKGVRVPFLFGTADRESLVDSVVTVARIFPREIERGDKPQKLVLHYNGIKLRKIDEKQAVKIAEEYRRGILHRWEREGRECDRPLAWVS